MSARHLGTGLGHSTTEVVEQQSASMFAHCKGPFWAIDDFSTCFEREYVMAGPLAVAKKEK